MAAQDIFEAADLAYGREHLASDGALKRPLGRRERSRAQHEGVRVVVDVRLLIMPEIDRVRLQDPGVADIVRMLQREGQRLPATGRRALDVARVRLADE